MATDVVLDYEDGVRSATIAAAVRNLPSSLELIFVAGTSLRSEGTRKFVVDLQRAFPVAAFVWINQDPPNARIPVRWELQVLLDCDRFVSSLVDHSVRILQIERNVSEQYGRPWHAHLQAVQPLSNSTLVSLLIRLSHSTD